MSLIDTLLLTLALTAAAGLYAAAVYWRTHPRGRGS